MPDGQAERWERANRRLGIARLADGVGNAARVIGTLGMAYGGICVAYYGQQYGLESESVVYSGVVVAEGLAAYGVGNAITRRADTIAHNALTTLGDIGL